MVKIRGRRLLVKMPKTQERTDLGIYIPECEQEGPQEGIVMGVGDNTMEVVVGDRVLFDEYAGLEVEDGVLILEERDLQGVITMQ